MTTNQNASGITSTLTDRYQTTIPEAVRHHLGLHKRDQLQYTIDETGQVTLHKTDVSEQDPALRPFLALLERDLTDHPERLESLDGLRTELPSLTHGAEFDLNAALGPDDE
ncbi:type II toxin-antitoxin system PrlF family antitoxin [Deinococcus sp. KNUC1210]|uniref:type II toxin-antitoxin system PrlF family antitoxin n=1 Tax=Deinococcus sp. KNUC1210 TaxID=2917691 RepID=UPI001EEFD5F8|nr:type II toxin-antitoxin system PrlF family antitoxin [Deinococcus sp. KNUC1210]ULH15515.1 type II toxin-antitoxin system PrlF family antitoxin [Deinococcus sp. KNUC1210]